MTSSNQVFLTQIKLHQFRNYDQLSLDLDHRHVVLSGSNGSGKTNLLEAVSFLSPGRGMRRATYDAVAKTPGNGTWSVFAQMHGMAGDVSIGTGLQEDTIGTQSQRRIRIDGVQARATDELLDHSRILWLTPAMDGLFTGPAGDRRRFLDRLVLAIDPAHGKRVSNYERTMRNRNKILKDDMPDAAWLDALEVQFAELATAIAFARMELITLLSRVIVENDDPNSPFPDALISMEGLLENMAGEISASDLEEQFLRQLHASRRLDAAAGRTLQGPHRSDLLVHHRPKAMKAALCSTGEQKALLIGLLLAHAKLVGDMHGAAPILLLDEVAAHLDSERRAALYEMIDKLGCQAWMTGTDQSLFEALEGRAQCFNVANGVLDPI
ncbi:MAG: DNA replication/repair protein RecF [Rhizobiaceae bacterium]|nr:DNA replication/repair protein RecF [Rhizobiaceae bacterium]